MIVINRGQVDRHTVNTRDLYLGHPIFSQLTASEHKAIRCLEVYGNTIGHSEGRAYRRPADFEVIVTSEDREYQFDFRLAYTYSHDQVVASLQAIVINPGVYGVAPENVPDLLLIHQDICRLRQAIEM